MKFRNLDLQFKVVFISIFVILGINFFLIPLYFFDLHHVVIGITIGSSFHALYFFIDHFINKISNFDKKNKSTIISIISRFILLVGFIFLFSILEFVFKVKIANVLAFVGGYILILIIYIIIYSRQKDN